MDYARAVSAATTSTTVIVDRPLKSLSNPEINSNQPNITPNTSHHSGIPSTSTTGQHQQTYVPIRKNAVIIDNTQEISQDQCLRAVADVVGGRNIHYCSRLSGGRVCIYLTDQDCVTSLVSQGGVTVGPIFLPCRRYVSDATKFIVSNCPPELSDEDLKSLLEPYGKIVSAPSRLRVTTSHDDLKHVKTWRRSIYMVIPDSAPEVPKRMLISGTDNNRYTLYIDKDEIVCTYCLTPGHLEERCKKKQNRDQDFPSIYKPASHRLFVHNRARPEMTTKIDSFSATNSMMPSFNPRPPVSEANNSYDNSGIFQQTLFGDPLIREEITQETSAAEENNPIPIPSPPRSSTMDISVEELKSDSEETPVVQDIVRKLNSQHADNKNEKAIKRRLSPDEDEDSFSDLSESSTSSRKKKSKQKKQDALASVINNMNFNKENCLSKEEFTEFLKDCRGKCNSKSIAGRYTSNFGALIVQLHEAENICMDFNLKRRLQRAAEALASKDDTGKAASEM